MGEGCSYGKVTRQMVSDMKESTDKGLKLIDTRLEKMENNMTDMFNHQSSRLPPWVAIIFTIGGSLITGMLMWIITH